MPRSTVDQIAISARESAGSQKRILHKFAKLGPAGRSLTMAQSMDMPSPVQQKVEPICSPRVHGLNGSLCRSAARPRRTSTARQTSSREGVAAGSDVSSAAHLVDVGRGVGGRRLDVLPKEIDQCQFLGHGQLTQLS